MQVHLFSVSGHYHGGDSNFDVCHYLGVGSSSWEVSVNVLVAHQEDPSCDEIDGSHSLVEGLTGPVDQGIQCCKRNTYGHEPQILSSSLFSQPSKIISIVFLQFRIIKLL